GNSTCGQLGKAFFTHKNRGRVDQLLQVFQPFGTFAVGLVMGQQGTVVDNVLNQLGQGQDLRLAGHILNQVRETHQAGSRTSLQVRNGTQQAGTTLTRQISQLLHRASTKPTSREVHDAQESGVIVRVIHQPQVSQYVLDFLTLEKAVAAI